MEGNPVSNVDPLGLFSTTTPVRVSPATPGWRLAPGVQPCLLCSTSDRYATLGPLPEPKSNPKPYVDYRDVISKRSPEDKKQAQAEHDLYKQNCMHKPFHPDKCTQLKMEITRAQLCWEGISKFDAKWDPIHKRHSIDIQIWQTILKRLMDQYKQECEKDCEVILK